MNASDESALQSDELRVAIQAYARRLTCIFSEMGRLAGPGLHMPRRLHRPMRIQAGDPNEERARHYSSGLPWSVLGEDTLYRATVTSPESELLQRWITTDGAPLLLMAPFGGGKSVVLETFALSQAQSLLKYTDYPPGSRPSFVPLPVRLRDWNWHLQETLRDYLYRSQFVLDPSQKGILQQSDIELLLRTGKLILLFDGFDELPGEDYSMGGASIRDQALRSIESLLQYEIECECPFIMTSRPGYDIEQAGLFDSEHRHFLRGYSREEIVEYVREQIRATHDQDDSEAIAALQFVDDDLVDMLARPLFLAVWCSEVIRNRNEPPISVQQIMQCVVLRTFNAPRIKQSLVRPIAPASHFGTHWITHEQILRSMPSLGALLFAFAESHFPRELPLLVVSERAETLLAGCEEYAWIKFLCHNAGLIQDVAPNLIYAIKIPLTEFLVGQYVASLAAGDIVAKRQYIETFRRWAWCPDLHNCLYFAIDSMRQGSSQQRELAAACVDWLLNIAETCPLSRRMLKQPLVAGTDVKDDLLHPFAVLAANLAGASPRTARLLLHARWRADNYYRDSVNRILGSIRPSAVLAYTEEALSQFELRNCDNRAHRFAELVNEAAVYLPDHEFYRFLLLAFGAVAYEKLPDTGYGAFGTVGRRLAPVIATKVILMWARTGLISEDVESTSKQNASMDEHAVAGAVSHWYGMTGDVDRAIGIVLIGAAARVPVQDAGELVEALIQTKHRSFHSVLFLPILIRALADRIPGAIATGVANAWIQYCIEDTNGHIDRWKAAIFSVAKRIPAGDAATTFRDWRPKISKMLEHGCIYLVACSAVVKHVGVIQARELFGELLSLNVPFYSSLTLDDKYRAIMNATEGLSSDCAMELFTTLRVELMTSDSGKSERWCAALVGLSRRVSDPARCIQELLMISGQVAKKSVRQFVAFGLLECAARVDVSRVGQVISTFLSECRIGFDEHKWRCFNDDSAYARMTELGKRVLPRAAEAMVQELMATPFRNPHFEPCHRFIVSMEWSSIMEGVITRVPQNDVKRLYRKFLVDLGEEEIDMDQADESRVIRDAIRWTQHVLRRRLTLKDALEIIEELDLRTQYRSVMQIASVQTGIVVVLSGFDSTTENAQYEFRRRSDHRLLLSDHPSVVPSEVRRILSEETQLEVAADPVPIGNTEILKVLITAIERTLDAYKAFAFERKMNGSKLSRYLNAGGAIRLVEASLGRTDRKLRLSKPLKVDRVVLNSALENNPSLVVELYQLAKVSEMEVPIPYLRLDRPVFVCPFCSALHGPKDLDGVALERLAKLDAMLGPTACVVCEARFNAAIKPVKCPEQPLWCHTCFANFMVEKERESWNAQRRRLECSNPLCEKKVAVPRLSQIAPDVGVQRAFHEDCRRTRQTPRTCLFFRAI